MTEPQRRRAARRTELGASTVAGSVGAAFGASKLRDAYREDPKIGPEKFARRVKQTRRVATRVAPSHADRLVHVAEHGKPGFRPLLVASAAGATAAGAGRYHDHLQRLEAKRRRQRAAVSKSQMPDGSYREANTLGRDNRVRVQGAAIERRMSGVKRQAAPTPRMGTRNTTAIFHTHAAGLHPLSSMRVPLPSSDPIKHRFHEGTTKSAVHPKIEYGASIPKEHHAALDAGINAAQAKRLRHPVVFHHASMGEGSEHIYAGAASAHVTTGHKGHVVMNSLSMHPSGHAMGASKVHGHEILAHEIEHAAIKKGPGRELTDSRARSRMRGVGEEARADSHARAQSGTGLYERIGGMGTKAEREAAEQRRQQTRQRTDRVGRRAGELSDRLPGAAKRRQIGGKVTAFTQTLRSREDQRRATSTETRYHAVADKIQLARRIHKSASVSAFGVDHGYALGEH